MTTTSPLSTWLFLAALGGVSLALPAGGCGSSGGGGATGSAELGEPSSRDGGGGGDARKTGVVVVQNPTHDSWDLAVGGAPRGSVAPGSEARLLSLPAGRTRLVASNARLGLLQEHPVEVVVGRPATIALAVQTSRLRVHNPYGDPVEVTLDGAALGIAAAQTETTFDAARAGRRMLVFKNTRGPGSVRVEHVLPPDGTSVLTVPDVSAQNIDPNAPKPPDGQGLIRMKNASRLLVNIIVGGRDLGVVPPGARFDIVLPPGTHTLEVKIEGIEARTEHTVTLIPNQVAEWVWGEEGGAP